jgi:hypothetical protein
MNFTKAAKIFLQSPEVKEAISATEGVRIETVRKWVRDEDDNLTKASVIKVIKDMSGLTEDQILEEPTKVYTIPE